MILSPEEWRIFAANYVRDMDDKHFAKLMRMARVLIQAQEREWIELAFTAWLWKLAFAFRGDTGVELTDSQLWWIINVTLEAGGECGSGAGP